MAENTIDSLDIRVSSTTTKAVSALENLQKKLGGVNTAFRQLNNSGLRNLSRDVNRLTVSINALNNVKLNTAKFTELNAQLQTLSRIDLKNLQNLLPKQVSDNVTKQLDQITKAFTNFKNASDNVGKAISLKDLSSIANVNFKDNGITAATNAFKRLLSLDMSKFNASGFQSVANSIISLSSIPDVSPALNKFISSFSNLASAGAKASTTAMWLPKLGTSLKDVTTKMIGLGEVNSSVTLFVQSLAKLASSGQKAGETASNLSKLGTELIELLKVLQNAPKISRDTSKMVEALAALSNSGGNVEQSTSSVNKAMSQMSRSSSSVSKTIKSSISKITDAFKSLGNVTPHINQANNGVLSLLKSISLVRVFYKTINTIKNSITLGSDLTEVGNVVKVAFGDMENAVYQFAETAKTQFGLSQIAAQNYAGTMQGMLTSAGISSDAAAKMSLQIAGLAGDYASFWNVSSDEAFKAIRSGLSGMSMPLRRFGKDLTVATLEEYALSQGITKSYKSMTYAEKVLLRYNYLLSASTNEMGDFERTSMNFANQWRVLKNNIQDVLTYIGQGFIAAIRPAVIALNTLMTKLIQAAKVFRAFMYTLTGYNGQGSQSGIVDDLAGYGDLYDDTVGLDDLTGGLDDATDSASKLKKALSVLSFDQLNQLSSASTSASTGISNIAGEIDSMDGLGDLGLSDIETDISELDSSGLIAYINKWAESIRLAFTHQQWDQLGYTIAYGINDGLDYIYEVLNWEKTKPKILKFVNAFSTTFNSLVDWLDFNRMGRLIGNGINTVIGTLNGLLTGIDWKNLGFKFSSGIMGIVQEVDWGELGKFVSNKFNAIWEVLYGFFTGLDPIVLGEEAAKFVRNAFETIDFDMLSNVLTSGMNVAIETMKKFIEEQPFAGLSTKLANFLNETVKNIPWNTLGSLLGIFLKRTISGISDFIKKTDFETIGSSIGQFLREMDWKGIVGEVGKLAWEAINAALETWKSSFDEAPVETVIITALASMKFIKLGTSVLGAVVWSKIFGSIMGSGTTALYASQIGSGVATTVSGAVTSTGVTNAVASSGNSLWAAMFQGFQPALAAAGVLIGISGIGIAIQKLSDIAKGGNGVLTDYGGIIDSISNNSAPDFAQRLFEVKEQLEDQGATIDEVKEALVEFFTAEGISADQLISMVNNVGGSINLTTEQMEIMYEVASKLPEAGQMSEEAFTGLKDSLYLLQEEMGLDSDAMTSLLGVLDQQYNSGMTAKETWKALTQQFEVMSISVDDVVKILGIDFVNTLTDVSDSAETTAKEIDTSMKNASSSVSSSSSSMAEDVSTNLEEIGKATENTFGNVESTSDKKWSAADLSVEDALKLMHSATSKQMRNIYNNVKSYTDSIYNITTNNWSALSLKVSQLMDEMNVTVSGKLEETKLLFDDFSKSVAEIANLYTAGQNAARTFANGFKSIHIPTPHMRIASWKQHNLPNGGMMQSPVFEVNWYKSGGLFNGASVIGVGEAGREAVLPLENRRTMRMIADSIVSNAGNGFMDETTMINAVAAGVSMAMSNVSLGGGQNDVVVMIDGREVARAVNKANAKMDYRFNP